MSIERLQSAIERLVECENGMGEVAGLVNAGLTLTDKDIRARHLPMYEDCQTAQAALDAALANIEALVAWADQQLRTAEEIGEDGTTVNVSVLRPILAALKEAP